MLNTVNDMDIFELLGKVADNSIDMILCDLPYGTTKNHWDTLIPFELMWAEFNRVAKERAAIVLTGAMPFSALLVASNITQYRDHWIWQKSNITRFLDAKKRPMLAHEDVLVFGKKRPHYYPQMREGIGNRASASREVKKKKDR